MASTKQVDKSPTWETPLEDSTFSNSFEASFIALQDVYKHQANLADLILMDASGLHVNNIIVYTPDPARSILFFYKVVGQCEAYTKVKRIFTWPGEDDKINDSGKLAPAFLLSAYLPTASQSLAASLVRPACAKWDALLKFLVRSPALWRKGVMNMTMRS